MPLGKPRRSRSASSVSSQAQVMLDPGPGLGLPGFKLLHGVAHFLRVSDRQRVAGIDGLRGLHSHAAVLGRYLHEVSPCQAECAEAFLWENTRAPLANPATAL